MVGEIKKVKDIEPAVLKEYCGKFVYQKELTNELDHIEDINFDEMMIFRIILWKISRYPDVKKFPFSELNQLANIEAENFKACEAVLRKMLEVGGIGLPMASTILRFRNPEVFPIIDRRAYRVVLEDKLKIYKSTKIDKQIETYFGYIERCREISNKCNIPFNQIDRVLYLFDKEENKGIKL
jgi:hypothetical protein